MKVICEHAEASKASGSLGQLSPRCHRAPALAVIAHPELGKEFQRSITNSRKLCQPKAIQMLAVATAPAQGSQWCPAPIKAPLKGVCLPVWGQTVCQCEDGRTGVTSYISFAGGQNPMLFSQISELKSIKKKN